MQSPSVVFITRHLITMRGINENLRLGLSVRTNCRPLCEHTEKRKIERRRKWRTNNKRRRKKRRNRKRMRKEEEQSKKAAAQ